MRLRVLHLINSFETCGTERQAVELLKRLNPERYDVRVAALHVDGPFYQEVAALFPSVPEFPLNSFYDLNAMKQVMRLRQLLKCEHVDVLHTHGFYDGLLGVTAARLTRTRVIAAQRHIRLSDRKVHAWGTRAIRRMAHRLLVNAEAIRAQVLREGGTAPEKIVVIRNGLMLAESLAENDLNALRDQMRARLLRELALPTDVLLVGCIARLHPVKGHQALLSAAVSVAQQHPSAHFVLIGDGPLRHELETQAQQAGLSGRVHFLGDRTDAAKLAAALDVAVLASLHEGLPNAVLESMAMATPVVATAVGGVPELVKENETGYLVPSNDIAKLGDGIVRALSDARAGSRIGWRGREFVLQACDMGTMVRSVESLYDELVVSGQ